MDACLRYREHDVRQGGKSDYGAGGIREALRGSKNETHGGLEENATREFLCGRRVP